MTAGEAGFDPGGYYAFDMARGAVRTKHGDRVLVLEAEIVAALIGSAVAQGDLTAIRGLGKRLGEDIARSLSAGQKQVSPEEMLTHAAGTLSVLGWGALGFERWGDALVLSLEAAPELDPGRLGLSALLGGMLTTLAGRDVACVPVAGGPRFIVVHPSTAEQIFSWTREGLPLLQVLARLVREGENT